MLKKLLHLGLFLLILCIGTTFDGLTQYPLNDLQMRKTARLMIEYTFLLDQNMSLTQMMEWCDGRHVQDSIAIASLQDLVATRDEQLVNRQEAIGLWKMKFETADEQVREEKKSKNLWKGGALIGLGLLIASFIFGG